MNYSMVYVAQYLNWSMDVRKFNPKETTQLMACETDYHLFHEDEPETWRNPFQRNANSTVHEIFNRPWDLPNDENYYNI